MSLNFVRPLIAALPLVSQDKSAKIIQQAKAGALTQSDLELYAAQLKRPLLLAFFGGCEEIVELNAANGGSKEISLQGVEAGLGL